MADSNFIATHSARRRECRFHGRQKPFALDLSSDASWRGCRLSRVMRLWDQRTTMTAIYNSCCILHDQIVQNAIFPIVSVGPPPRDLRRNGASASRATVGRYQLTARQSWPRD